MAKAMGAKATARLETVVLAQSFEMAALVNVLKRKGLLTRAEILDEVRRLREQAARAR